MNDEEIKALISEVVASYVAKDEIAPDDRAIAAVIRPDRNGDPRILVILSSGQTIMIFKGEEHEGTLH